MERHGPPDIEVLIGHTADEARLFLPGNPVAGRLAKIPVLGPAAVNAVSRAVTEAVYGRAARKFARRHARAGGKAYSYVLTWAAPGNFYGAAHTVDLPLLFGNSRPGPRPGFSRAPPGTKSTPRAAPSAPSGPGSPPGKASTAGASSPAHSGTARSEPG